MSDLGKVVSIQILPFKLDFDRFGEPHVECQPKGANDDTRGWAVYLRHENGMAFWNDDFDHPMDAVEHALNEIDGSFPEATIERSWWSAPVDPQEPHIAILRCPDNSVLPYCVKLRNHPTTNFTSRVRTEADAISEAVAKAASLGIKVAAYRWQK